MIRRTFNAVEVNSFANHPDILPHISPTGEPLDLGYGINETNVFLFGEHGGICWIWSAPNTYEGHVMLTRSGRGAWGVDAGRASVEYMASLKADLLWCRVHPDRPHIAAYASSIGMRPNGMVNMLDAGEGPVNWRIFERRLKCPQQ